MKKRTEEHLARQFFQTTTIDPPAALNLFLNRGVNATTFKNDEHRLMPFCERFAGAPIQNVTSNDIDIWIDELKSRLGPASVESYKQSTKAFFNWCVKNNSIPHRTLKPDYPICPCCLVCKKVPHGEGSKWSSCQLKLGCALSFRKKTPHAQLLGALD